MSGEPARAVTGWTVETLMEFQRALAVAQEKFEAERDRRLTEVAVEREKALKIKEEADKSALELERISRDYKDEKANNLREQISGERGNYATKDDLVAAVSQLVQKIGPLADFVTAAQSVTLTTNQARTNQRLDNGQLLAIVVAVIALAGFVLAVTR
jgi:hypothetical protein